MGFYPFRNSALLGRWQLSFVHETVSYAKLRPLAAKDHMDMRRGMITKEHQYH
jgi:hypothetical protein